jgi:polar amino acid transport system substrate-binding protein
MTAYFDSKSKILNSGYIPTTLNNGFINFLLYFSSLNSKAMYKKINVLSLLLIFCFAITSSAQETIKRIQDNKKIVLGTSGTQEPFSFKDEGDTLMGIDIEIANSLAEAMGVELEVKEIEFSKLIEELNNGNVDFVMSGMSMKIHRNMEVAFAGPYFRTEKAVITTKTGLKSTKMESMNVEGVKLAAISNSTSEYAVTDLYPNAELVKVKDYNEAVEKLKANEVNAFLADFETCVQLSLKDKALVMKTIKDIDSYDPLGIAVKGDDALFLNLIENYMDAIISSGYVDYLEEIYDVDE